MRDRSATAQPTTLADTLAERGFVPCACGAAQKRTSGPWECGRRGCDILEWGGGTCSVGHAACREGRAGALPRPTNEVAGSPKPGTEATGMQGQTCRPVVGSQHSGPRTTAHPTPSRAVKSWSNATATVCAAGHRHPSKMEARVCDRLTAEAAACGGTLFRQVRFPLFSLAPTDSGLPHYITVDFVLELPSNIVHKSRRYIDAKHPKRVSPEWRRGSAAFHSCYGSKIEEVSS